MEFGQFQELNNRRCHEAFSECNDWEPRDWAVAIAGEAGEMCNWLKKFRRGDMTLEEVRPKVLKELADIITYSDLLISRLGAVTEDEVLKKFYEVSQRRGWTETPEHKLPSPKPRA